MIASKEVESPYKSKYYKLKAQIATTSEPTEKGFVAEEERDWADSDDSWLLLMKLLLTKRLGIL